MNINKLTLAGRLTRDPETRYTPQGRAITKISIATNRVWKAESGEKKEEVTFVDCDAFGTQAENITKYFKKGNPIYIEGRLKLDSWEDKNTHQKQSKLKVVVESFQFVGRTGESAESKPAPATGPAPVESEANEGSGIPF